MSAMVVTPLTGVIGAEISGIDLSRELAASDLHQVRTLLNEHQVLFFRDQDITPDDQATFARGLGEIMEPLVDLAGSPYPGLTVLDQTSGSDPGYGDTGKWHTDHPFVAEPPMAAMLRAVELPPVGGDTSWSSMHAAYDALSPSFKALIRDLTAVHSTASLDQQLTDVPESVRYRGRQEAVHPLTRIHPETGRPALYISQPYTTRVVELEEAESRALLDFLFVHVRSPQFQCRFKWAVNSIALWDERSTQHCAIADYAGRRVMHRCMLAGDRPYGPDRG